MGPFVMAEGGEEWFPFTLDNLEMDRACSYPQEDTGPMDQVGRCKFWRLLYFSTFSRTLFSLSSALRTMLSKKEEPHPEFARHRPKWLQHSPEAEGKCRCLAETRGRSAVKSSVSMTSWTSTYVLLACGSLLPPVHFPTSFEFFGKSVDYRYNVDLSAIQRKYHYCCNNITYRVENIIFLRHARVFRTEQF